MNVKWRLLKNVGYLTIGAQAANLLQFVFFLYFARTFGDELVGRYSFGFSFTYVLSVLADMGVSAYLILEVARNPLGYRQWFVRGLMLRAISLAVMSLVGIVVVAVFFRDLNRSSVYVLILLGAYHLLLGFADIFLAELKGHDRMGLVAALGALIRFLITGSGIVLIALGADYLWVIGCFPISALGYLAVVLVVSIRLYGAPPMSLSDLEMSNLLKRALPFAFALVFVEVWYNADTLMLRFLANDQAVGMYSVAQRIVMIFPGMLMCAFTALLPTFSRLYVESRAALSALSGHCLRYVVLLGLPISAGLFVVSHKAIVLLFTDAFAAAATSMAILSWTVALNCTALTASVLLTACGRQTAKSIGIGFCMGVNVGANYILIPRAGCEGAAWARLIAEVLHLAILTWLARELLRGVSWWKILAKPAASCLVMYAILAKLDGLNIWGLMAIGPVIYFGSLFLLRGFEENEIKWMGRTLRRVAMLAFRQKGLEWPR
jgi:O-antigen/teichoic acid export membrane protein